MIKTIVRIAALVLLEFLIDSAFSFFYPLPVNPYRAMLISAVALLVLLGLNAIKKEFINPFVGVISIFSSAYFGAILVQEGYLVSKSVASGLVHVALLSATFILVSSVFNKVETISKN